MSFMVWMICPEAHNMITKKALPVHTSCTLHQVSRRRLEGKVGDSNWVRSLQYQYGRIACLCASVGLGRCMLQTGHDVVAPLCATK
jgi:hypothetical protein